MKIKNMFILVGICLILLMPNVFATDLYYKSGEDIGFQIPCYNNDEYCSSGSDCFLTVVNPFSNTIVDNQSMSIGQGFASYNITKNLTGTIGEYQASVVCQDGGVAGKTQLSFLITNENRNYQDILATVLGLGIIAFFFLFLATKLGEDHFLLSLFLVGGSMWYLPLIMKALMWSERTHIQAFNLTVIIISNFFMYIIIYFIWWLFNKRGPLYKKDEI